jgi:hypothetical protein
VAHDESEKHEHASAVRGAVAWSSFGFALLQSICTFFAAANGFRLAIGVGALALSAGAASAVKDLHGDALRIPMVAIALLGSLLNLAVLAQIRQLRRRPSAQWRRAAPEGRKLRGERVQFLLAVASLVLIVVEEGLHLHFHGHL